MAIFGRKKRNLDEVEEAEGAEQAAASTPEGQPGVDRDWEREVDGPFDVSERPDLAGRVDLGPLKIPAVKGMELRLDVEQKTNNVVGVTCSLAQSKIQLQAFAAPRSAGVWSEIRPQIVEGLVNAGGRAEVVDGVLGKEVVAQLPTRTTDGKAVLAPARFLGVDGPRWFLRAVINGPAANNEKALLAIQTFVRLVVVDRGEEPRPPREVLHLSPPAEFVEEMNRRAAAAKAARVTRTPAPAGAQDGAPAASASSAAELPGAEPDERR